MTLCLPCVYDFMLVFMMTLHRSEGRGRRGVLSSTEVRRMIFSVKLNFMWHGRFLVHFDQLQSTVSRFDKLDSDASAGRSLLL